MLQEVFPELPVTAGEDPGQNREASSVFEADRPFTRDTRLRARKQFAYVRADGSKQVGRLMIIQAAPSLDGHLRLATVISRRYSGKAVDRNRARRLCREAYRRVFRTLVPCWLILVPRWQMKNAKLDQVLAELEMLCSRVGISTKMDQQG